MSQLPIGKYTSSQKLNRRKWLQTGSAGIAGLTVSQNTVSASNSKESSRGDVPLLRMSPPLFVGSTDAERTQFLRRVRTMRVRTVSMATPATWSEKQVEEARHFLDNHGLQVGEFSGFHGGFASLDTADNKAAMDHYRRQLHHAKIIGAHCVGFAILCGRIYNEDLATTFADRKQKTPRIWSDTLWRHTIETTRELAREAESIGVDIAAHPHVITPLNSAKRYRQLLESVASERLKVLLDPVNLTWPHMFFHTTDLINELFDEVGPSITAVHAKDMTMSSVKSVGEGLSIIHADESVPGTGGMDYATLLKRMVQYNQKVTIHVEHFSERNTIAGQEYIRYIGRENNISIG